MSTVTMELSQAQVDQVIREAGEAGSMTLLLSGLASVRETLNAAPRLLDNHRLSRSLLAGLVMLASFPTNGSYIGNNELARALEMSPSTVHRYLATLLAVGLVERDPHSRRYRLAQPACSG